MTTIAYRDGILAADTKASIGDSAVGHITKIARRADGALAAAAGGAGYNFAFLEWFALNDETIKPPEAKANEHSFDRGVIFFQDGRIFVYEPDGKFSIKAPYYVLGSGREIALGAMFMEATAEQAVKAAIYHDNGTGGYITILRHTI